MSNVGDDFPGSPGGPGESGGPDERRGNGLSSAGYTAIAEVDPLLGTHLLEVMRHEGIAAYVLPSPDGATPALPGTPGGRRDLLYVDRGRVAEATDLAVTQAVSLAGGSEDSRLVVLEGQEGRRDDREDQDEGGYGDGAEAADWDPVPDEEWAALVAQIERSPSDADDDAGPESPRETPTGPSQFRAVEVGGLTFLRRAAPEPLPGDEPDSDEDHYEPPPPPPIPQLSPTARWGLRAIVAGLVFLLLPVVAGWEASALLLTLAIGCIAGGSVALLSRLRDGPSQDDGWDDGAVL